MVCRGGCVLELGSREAEVEDEDEIDRNRDMLEVRIFWRKEKKTESEIWRWKSLCNQLSPLRRLVSGGESCESYQHQRQHHPKAFIASCISFGCYGRS